MSKIVTLQQISDMCKAQRIRHYGPVTYFSSIDIIEILDIKNQIINSIVDIRYLYKDNKIVLYNDRLNIVISNANGIPTARRSCKYFNGFYVSSIERIKKNITVFIGNIEYEKSIMRTYNNTEWNFVELAGLYDLEKIGIT